MAAHNANFGLHFRKAINTWSFSASGNFPMNQKTEKKSSDIVERMKSHFTSHPKG